MQVGRLPPIILLLGQVVWTLQIRAADPSTADASQLKRLRERCEKIVVAEFAEPLPKGALSQELLYSLRLAPLRLAEQVLLDLLHDQNPDTRLTASEILWERTHVRHKRELTRSLQ